MKKKHKRLLTILGFFLFLNCLILYVLMILKDNISFYYTVSEAVVLTNYKNPIRIGGIVMNDSILYTENELLFQITDLNQIMTVIYQGILPPMFSEGSGVVVQGKMTDNNNIFLAEFVFAKHDEHYIPKK
ncbi:cytochrome c maturation protein CcmE [Wolbachia endosymbiont of Howardula sp.]|uniref:cytochrome c maturation protein CcmE n=1 Tax=Wolbachia endosymbiont of Howardula sp. TaxID=2916816 RepID=UPI00217F1B69|nr:cytochrome c maturation protein CcmE [Wolbachia endosymbiont of Howardula sp.]UWI83216.1 cytochrome c maturation protein CcmE [Wolbachia endosymbiont of Howardula sp.]